MSPHAHGPDSSARPDRRYLVFALVLLLVFMAGEVVVGLLAGSLALLSDAAHMLTDVAALGLTLWTATVALRPASRRMTFGLGRLEVLSAQINGATLVIVALWLFWEGVNRLITPPEVDGAFVAVVALIGIPVNVVAVWAVGRADRRSLNVEGSFQHMLTDLYAFIATAIAGGLIYFTGWNRLDAAAALLVAALMMRAGVPLVVEATRILIQAAPRHLEVSEVEDAMEAERGIVEVRDLRLWAFTPDAPTLSARVIVHEESDCHQKRKELQHLLADRFGIERTTLEMDHA